VHAFRHAAHLPPLRSTHLQPAEIPSQALSPTLGLPLLARFALHHLSPESHRRLPPRGEFLAEPPTLKPCQHESKMLLLPVRKIPRGSQVVVPISRAQCVHAYSVPKHTILTQGKNCSFAIREDQASETISDAIQDEPRSHHGTFLYQSATESPKIKHLEVLQQPPYYQYLRRTTPDAALQKPPGIPIKPPDRIKLLCAERSEALLIW